MNLFRKRFDPQAIPDFLEDLLHEIFKFR